MAEIRPIPGYPDYFASDKGEIFSMKRRMSDKRSDTIRMRKLRPGKDTKGYNYLVLYKGPKEHRNERVCRLVLLSFVGPPPPNMETCHGPNGKADDSLKNLSWGTKKKNYNADKKRDGTLLEGTRHPQAKLSEEQVLKIRELKGKYSQPEIANMFGISKTHVGQIHRNVRWQSL